MITITRKLSPQQLNNTIVTCNSSSRIYFDIETTGFSRSGCMIYLVGCVYWQEGELLLTQFLAEEKSEEKQILKSFLCLLSSFTEIVTFNGNSFDLPFVEARCRHWNLLFSSDAFQTIDYYKDAQYLKELLRLDNYKQKTIEHFFEIRREDSCDGGELISIYHDFVKSRDKESLNLLLLHNYEDVLGLLKLTVLQHYAALFQGVCHVDDITVSNYEGLDSSPRHDLFFSFHSENTLPKRVTCQCHGFYLLLSNEGCVLRIPVFEGELRHYYSDYKNYYYLPLEDRAIHKSVASYVDREHRTKCNSENCYIRQSGLFLPQLEETCQPTYSIQRKDEMTYFALNEEMLQDSSFLDTYLNRILNWIREGKK